MQTLETFAKRLQESAERSDAKRRMNVRDEIITILSLYVDEAKEYNTLKLATLYDELSSSKLDIDPSELAQAMQELENERMARLDTFGNYSLDAKKIMGEFSYILESLLEKRRAPR